MHFIPILSDKTTFAPWEISREMENIGSIPMRWEHYWLKYCMQIQEPHFQNLVCLRRSPLPSNASRNTLISSLERRIFWTWRICIKFSNETIPSVWVKNFQPILRSSSHATEQSCHVFQRGIVCQFIFHDWRFQNFWIIDNSFFCVGSCRH